MQVSLVRIVGAGLMLGLVLNLLGWVGNVFWLGPEWRAAELLVPTRLTPPYPDLAREALTFVSDFVFAIALCWLFARMQRRDLGSALLLTLVFWAATVGMVYLAMVNAGFVPLALAVKTSLLALAIFLICAPLLPRLVGRG